MRAGDRHIRHHLMKRELRLGTFAPIEERLLDEEHLMLLGEARKELLRSLPYESPAQMAEDDDAIAIGEFVFGDFDLFSAGGFDDSRRRCRGLGGDAGHRIAQAARG